MYALKTLFLVCSMGGNISLLSGEEAIVVYV